MLVLFARDLPTRLTSDPAFDWYTIWSLDGSRIVFRTDRGGVSGPLPKVRERRRD